MRNLLFSSLVLFGVAAHASDAVISKVLFGSCAHQDKKIEILQTVVAEDPDLFIFLGDNIYGDTHDMEELQAKYEKLGKNPNFRSLINSTETIATWDDHDFGENDAGGDYPHKEKSKQLMLDFWQEPENSQRRQQQDGIYTSYMYGSADKTIQVILLDLRYNREQLNSVSKWTYVTDRKNKNMGPYLPSESLTASMLGENQWRWFEQELKKPATIKIIGSSLQVLPDFGGWEAWINYPHDRNRLFNFIEQNQINGVLLISGDTHWGEISKFEESLSYPLWEVTSSGLTQEWSGVSPNKHRIGPTSLNVNYGYINIDWSLNDPLIDFGFKNIDAKVVNNTQLKLSDISPFNK